MKLATLTVLSLMLICQIESRMFSSSKDDRNSLVGESVENVDVEEGSATMIGSHDIVSGSGYSIGDSKDEIADESIFTKMVEQFSKAEFGGLREKINMSAAVDHAEKVVWNLKSAAKLHGQIVGDKIGESFTKMKQDAKDFVDELKNTTNTIQKETAENFKSKKNAIIEYINGKTEEINQHIDDMGIFDENKRKEMSKKIKNRIAKSKYVEIAKKKGNKGIQRASAASSGFKSFVTGVQNGQWLEIVTGVLGMVAGIAALFGPAGTMIFIGLTILSTLISIFGSMFGPEQESTEDVIKRVLDKALKEAKADELRAEAVGLRKLYGEVSRSIGNFRKKRKIKPAQAMKLYNMVFKGVTFFGYLDSYIKRDCDIDDKNSYTKEKLKEKSNRCLEFLNLYCDLSIARQMLMMDLSSFLIDLAEGNSALDKDKKPKLTEDSKLQLRETSQNILKLLSKEQRANMKFLLFLYNPVDFP